MKTIIKTAILVALAAMAFAGCDDDSSDSGGSSGPYLGGVWDFTLIPEAAPDKQYTVAVETGGGSGSAMVSVTGPGASNAVTVNNGDSVALGPCGAWISFSGASFNMVAGDVWEVLIQNGSPGLPVSGDTVYSTLDSVTTGGQDACPRILCDGSMLATGVPPSAGGLIPMPVDNPQWLSVRIDQTNSNVTAEVAEQHALSLQLGSVPIPTFPFFLAPLVSAGDSVTLKYRRRVVADGAEGDFFRVVVINGVQNLDAEYLWGTPIAGGDTVKSVTFIAENSEVRVDFIAGLSQAGENVTVDQIEVSTSGGVTLSEDFEAGPGPDCNPTGTNAGRWEARKPAWAVGSNCVSANGALEGTYSARWMGGSRRQITGSVLTGGSALDLGSLLGSGISFGSELAGFSGAFLEVWEPDWTGFFTSVAATEQSSGNLFGTFKGESRWHDCVEAGQLNASLHRSEETDLSSRFWVLRVDGQAFNCLPELTAGETITVGDTVYFAMSFGDTLATSTGDTVQVMQIGQIFFGTESVIDGDTNEYDISGLVSGTLVNFRLTESNNLAEAVAIGVAETDLVRGALTGTLLFDAGRVCDLNQASFVVYLVDN